VDARSGVGPQWAEGAGLFRKYCILADGWISFDYKTGGNAVVLSGVYKPQLVGGELIKSRGDWRLVQPLTSNHPRHSSREKETPNGVPVTYLAGAPI
jgi:hypothetical protein